MFLHRIDPTTIWLRRFEASISTHGNQYPTFICSIPIYNRGIRENAQYSISRSCRFLDVCLTRNPPRYHLCCTNCFSILYQTWPCSLGSCQTYLSLSKRYQGPLALVRRQQERTCGLF